LRARRSWVGGAHLPLAADTLAQYDRVERIFLPVAVAVFVAFSGAIVLTVWRGRRRTRGSGRSEHNVLEGVYVAVLAIAAGILVAVTLSAESDVRAATGAPGLRVRVVAAKWRWRFEYPGLGKAIQGTETRVPTLVVPADTDVEFEGESLDVIHAFWIPAVRFQRELFAGRPTHFRLRFEHPGFLSSSRCSFFCGLHHQDMRFGVQVLSPAAFRAWAARR
jgi:cytochrome c oxidase subunit 2